MREPSIAPLPARLALFLLYVAGSAVLGERLPFSRFSMFSQTQDRASVLSVLADGRPVDVRTLEGFRGAFLEADRTFLNPWLAQEFESYVRAGAAAQDGPLSVEARVCTCEAEPDAPVRTDCRTLWKGTARRRS